MSSPPRYVRTRFGPSSMRTPSRWSGINASMSKVIHKPAGGEVGDYLERARLLEEVRRAGDDLDLVLTPHMAGCVTVHLEHSLVASAHDQERGRADRVEAGASQVGPAATRHDRPHGRVGLGCRPQRRTRARAGAEEADRKRTGVLVVAQPGGRSTEPSGEERDIEHVGAVGFLLR